MTQSTHLTRRAFMGDSTTVRAYQHAASAKGGTRTAKRSAAVEGDSAPKAVKRRGRGRPRVRPGSGSSDAATAVAFLIP